MAQGLQPKHSYRLPKQKRLDFFSFFFSVVEDNVTHSPCCFTGILIGCSEDEYVAVLVDANVIGIATRGCSVGKGFDELASQRESGDVDKDSRHK